MRRRMLAALALVPVLGLGLPACGDGGNPSGKGTAKAVSDLEKMRKYAQCMRANGIDMEDPTKDGEGVNLKMKGPKGGPPKGGQDPIKAAETKCRHLMPNGGKPKKLDAKQLAQGRAHAKCMRENGVDMPDPDPNGGGTVMKRSGEAGASGPGDVGPESQKFKDAEKACRKFRPGGEGPGNTKSGG